MSSHGMSQASAEIVAFVVQSTLDVMAGSGAGASATAEDGLRAAYLTIIESSTWKEQLQDVATFLLRTNNIDNNNNNNHNHNNHNPNKDTGAAAEAEEAAAAL
jgi:hypothetical protein